MAGHRGAAEGAFHQGAAQAGIGDGEALALSEPAARAAMRDLGHLATA